VTLPQKFPGGKRIAVTTSWDDGAIDDRRLIESFNRWGIKGTFNLNSGNLGKTNYVEPGEVSSLYAGHEVAIHSVTHPHLTELDAAAISKEVSEDRKALESLVGYSVRGMAYPFGDYDQKVIGVLREMNISYCRTVENPDPCFPPAERLAWGNTCHHLAKNPSPLERFFGLIENPSPPAVLAIWGHSWEFSRANDWDALQRVFQPLARHSEVWYCTNIELFDWMDGSARQ
jgi:peptidoglycan-N-acetylglucosamine deacetylase